MRFAPHAIAGLGFLLTACATIMTTDDLRFSVRPFGEPQKLKTTKPQEGTHSLLPPARQNFREMTIAQGSGRDGFHCLRIFADGKGYAAVGLPETSRHSEGFQVPIQLSSAELDGLLAAMRQDGLHRVKGEYSSGVDDGVQGFVEVVTSEGRVYAWLDNYFDPVAHTYHFCNAQIWPQVRKSISHSRSESRHDLQEEYRRVFKE